MKRDTLKLSQHQFIETGLDWNGRYFVAYSSGASVFIRDQKELIRWMKIPKSLPMRASLDSWLASLNDTDAQRNSAEPLTSGATIQQTSPSLSQEKPPVEEGSAEPGAGSWDPLCHPDADDPTFQTKMIT